MFYILFYQNERCKDITYQDEIMFFLFTSYPMLTACNGQLVAKHFVCVLCKLVTYLTVTFIILRASMPAAFGIRKLILGLLRMRL